MCAINGIFSLNNSPIKALNQKIDFMNNILKYRGPDNQSVWCNNSNKAAEVIVQMQENDKSTSNTPPEIAKTINEKEGKKPVLKLPIEPLDEDIIISQSLPPQSPGPGSLIITYVNED